MLHKPTQQHGLLYSDPFKTDYKLSNVHHHYMPFEVDKDHKNLLVTKRKDLDRQNITTELLEMTVMGV